MRPTAHAAADRFLRSSRSARPYVMGLAIAAAALACPTAAEVLQDGVRAAVTLWPAADPIQTVASYFDGSMTLVASALRGVGRLAEGQGVELAHPAREALRDAAVWLGLREPEAQTFSRPRCQRPASSSHLRKHSLPAGWPRARCR